MLKELIKLANHLDQKGLMKEADRLDLIIQKYSMSAQAAMVRAIKSAFNTLTSHVTSRTKSENVGRQMSDAFGDGVGRASPPGGMAPKIDLHYIEVSFRGSITGMAPSGKFYFDALQKNNDLENPIYDILFVKERPDMPNNSIRESSEVKEAILIKFYEKLMSQAINTKNSGVTSYDFGLNKKIARDNPLGIDVTIKEVGVSEGKHRHHNKSKPNVGGGQHMPEFRRPPEEAPPVKPTYRPPSN